MNSIIAIGTTHEQIKKLNKDIQVRLKERDFRAEDEKNMLIADNLIIGMKRHDEDSVRKMAAQASSYAQEHHFLQVTIIAEEYAQAASEGAELGLYEYNEYLNKKKTRPKIIISSADKKAVARGKIIAEGVMLTRDLVNRPASDKKPRMMVAEAKRLGKKYGFTVKVLGDKELKQLGMNSMLGVNRGSHGEAQLCILEIKGSGKATALVGKGVTFDAGGLQIKPGDYMLDMKMDMGGAATVLGSIVTLARLGVKGRFIGAMGLVENLVGPDSYKPKDILKSHNGKTIEVWHTDAEGRLVLADVLSYIEKTYKPQAMIDLATLTGAAIFSLGYRVAALLGNDEKLIERIKASSTQTDELVWELPLHQHYKDMMKGDISDLRNIHKTPDKYGPGTITAAAFLNEFVTDKTPWAHLDIAGTAFAYEKTAYVAKGGTGWGVRLLTNMFTTE